MPLHRYIKEIYEDLSDPQYIVRFLYYLISKRYKRYVFTVNEISVAPLITGILEDIKTKQKYYSLAEFYISASGKKINESDVNILSNIFITKEYTIMRIICNSTEDDILGFFDQNYRAFLMYRDIKKRISHYALMNINREAKLLWNGNEFEINYTKLTCKQQPALIYTLLETYEDGFIEGLYFCKDDTKFLISEK